MGTEKGLRRTALAVMAIIVLLPLFSAGIWYGHDWEAHLLRMTSLNQALAHGQFPPLFDYWNPNQYGYSWQMFYPPLSSLLFLLARGLTFGLASDILQMKLVFAFILAIGFGSACYAGKREHNSTRAGLLCGLLFITSAYFLNNLYVRFAVGECLAMAVMPLFVRGCSSLISDRRDSRLIPIAASLILLSNIPSVIVSLIFFLLFAALNARALFTRRNLLFLTRSVLLILALTCLYWGPLLYHMLYSEVYAFKGMLFSYRHMDRYKSDLLQTLLGVPSHYGLTQHGTYSAPGLPLLLLSLAALLMPVARRGKTLLLCGLVMVLLTTNLVNWNWLPAHTPLINIMQFSWRLLMCACALLALYAVVPLQWLLAHRRGAAALMLAALLAAAGLPVKSALDQPLPEFQTTRLYADYLNTRAMQGNTYDLLAAQTLPPTARDHLLQTPGGYLNGYPTFHVSAPAPALYTLPYVMYAGYTLIVDGQSVAPVPLDDGFMGVRLLPGEHTVTLSYQTLIVIVPALISLSTLLVMVCLWLRKRLHRPLFFMRPPGHLPE